MSSAFYYQPTAPHAFSDAGYYRAMPTAFMPASSPLTRPPKRKFDSSSSSEDDRDSSRSPSPRPTVKRRRCATIERGLDGLQLNPPPPPQPVVEEPDDFPVNKSTGHPYSYYPAPEEVEEYTPPTREVHMHNSSWYEPEKDRIIVTDLDASDSEAEPDTDADADGSLKLSSALYDALKRSAIPGLSLPREQASSALVLFRPSPWSSTLPPPTIEVLDDAEPEVAANVDVGEPMDIDPMDVEEL